MEGSTATVEEPCEIEFAENVKQADANLETME